MHASNLLKAVLKPRALSTTAGKKQSLVNTPQNDGSCTKGNLMSSSDHSSLPSAASVIARQSSLRHSSSPPPVKMTCLCSPTSHPGSFRCRLHRTDKQSPGAASSSSSETSTTSCITAPAADSSYQAAMMRAASTGMHNPAGSHRPSPLAKSPPGRPSRLNRMVANAQSEEDRSVAPAINDSCVQISSTFANNGRCFMRPSASMADNPREIYSEYCQSTSKKAMDVFDRNMTRMYL
ncbi:unnamed protein product [Sphagnum jensenii]|jgi:hypothetical protein|uniref:Uncharacterized protein n=1 Tax=Sphagnum jensenii TaxID=128206 RepID=A0ABP0XHZ4_9BRYO